MIAITGANGNLGKATISFLLQQTKPENIVAIGRDAAKMQPFASAGVQVRVADYNDPASLEKALEGVQKVLQISTSSYGTEADRQEQNVVQAAKAAGVQHIVYTSTAQPGTDAHFLAGQTCFQTEEAIKATGIGYTFFRNSMYMETIPLFIGSAWEDGQIYYPAADGKVSFVARMDIAQALSNVLSSGNHRNAVYNITGTQAYSFGDIAALLRSEKGLADATYTDIPNEALREELAKLEMPAGEIDFYLSMADSIKAGEFEETDNALETLLNRKRTSLQEFIKNS